MNTTAFASARSDATSGRMTVADFGRYAINLIVEGIRLAEPLLIPGSDKKAMVIAEVAALFDACADKCIPAYAYPAWLVIRSSVRALVLAAAGGALEAILVMVRAQG